MGACLFRLTSTTTWACTHFLLVFTMDLENTPSAEADAAVNVSGPSTLPIDLKKDGTASKMRSHRGNVPVLPKTKLCSHCSATFTRTTHLNRHLRTRKLFDIDSCVSNAHRALSDTNERQHQCDVSSPVLISYHNWLRLFNRPAMLRSPEVTFLLDISALVETRKSHFSYEFNLPTLQIRLAPSVLPILLYDIRSTRALKPFIQPQRWSHTQKILPSVRRLKNQMRSAASLLQVPISRKRMCVLDSYKCCSTAVPSHYGGRRCARHRK